MPGGIRRFNVASSTGKLTSRRDLATHIMQPAPRVERKDFSIFDLAWINADVKIDFFGPFVTNCKRDKIETDPADFSDQCLARKLAVASPHLSGS